MNAKFQLQGASQLSRHKADFPNNSLQITNRTNSLRRHRVFSWPTHPSDIVVSYFILTSVDQPSFVPMHVPSEDSSSGQGQQKQQKRLGLDAAAGALSGAISRFLVGPLDVVKIRFQVQLEPIGLETALTKRPPHYHGFAHAFRTIVAEEGIKVRCQVAKFSHRSCCFSKVQHRQTDIFSTRLLQQPVTSSGQTL